MVFYVTGDARFLTILSSSKCPKLSPSDDFRLFNFNPRDVPLLRSIFRRNLTRDLARDWSDPFGVGSKSGVGLLDGRGSGPTKWS